MQNDYDQAIAEVGHNLRGGYSQDELDEMFSSVQNKEHWKGEINARCCADNINVIAVAVEYFTATNASFKHAPRYMNDPEPFIVTAPGYWAGPAA